MDVVRGHERCPAWSGAAVAIGNFDGVHAGHRALIARTRELAAANGDAKAVALTFDPHPSMLFAPHAAEPRISSLARRLELLEEAGVDAVVVEPFTRELAGRAAHAFVDDIVLGSLRACAIVVGYDFNYGAGRTGTAEALRAHGARAGIEVAIVPPVEVGGEVASSTRIRDYLRAGDVAGAERLLCRPWDIDGEVVHGAKRGRAIGIPTANIAPTSDLLLAPGIYAVTASIDRGAPLPAVASLGTNPTFVDQGGLVLEVHLLDWEGDLYGRTLRTTFVARLREERKFANVDELVAQIHGDIADAWAVLAR